MKRTVLLFILLLVATFALGHNVSRTDKHGHILVGQWEAYYDALDADVPQRQMKILSEIKANALTDRIDWDYYDACVKYAGVGTRRDWKQREKLEDACRQELVAYGEPFLMFLYESNLRWRDTEANLKMILENKEKLLQGCHSVIYKEVNVFPLYDEVLLPTLKNDYEYALWKILISSALMQSNDIVGELLAECVKGGYPQEFFVDYYRACTLSEKENLEQMKSLSARYSNRAVSMLADAAIMDHELENMETDGASSADYLALKDRLLSCENTRPSYTEGVDGLIAKEFKGFKTLLNTLEESKAVIAIDKGVASIALRNIPSVTLRLSKDKKVICQTLLKNKEDSFYKPDTLVHELPKLHDGEYLVECLDAKDSVICKYSYPKYTISLAYRKDARGLAVYAADYITGKPLQKVDLVLTNKEDTLKHSIFLDGFTYLPVDVTERLNDYNSLDCMAVGEDGLVRRSWSRYFRSGSSKDTKDYVRTAVVMTDRGAFNPGDVVKYKAVIFDRHRDASKTAVLPKGTQVLVTLCHGTKLISETKHVLNEFGSLAGEFVLGEGLRNGNYRISVRQGDNALGGTSVTLDSFVLPTFNLEFDESYDYYSPGDTVVVRGRLKSYSGHPLSSASARVIVKSMLEDRVVLGEMLTLRPDGTFELSFVSNADQNEHYKIEVRVTDATGETQSFLTTRMVSESLNLRARLVNKKEGKFLVGQKTERNIFSGNSAVIRCEAFQWNEVKDLSLEYELYRDGKVVKSGNVHSSDDLKLDFSSLPSGLYRFSLHTKMKTSEGRYSGKLDDMYLLKIGSEDIADPLVDNLFCVENEGNISITLGSGNVPAWHVVEIFDRTGKRVISEVVYLEKGLVRLNYEFLEEYGDFVKVGLFRFFDSTSQSFTIKCDRPVVEPPQAAMTFTRFIDRTLPGKHYSYSLKGNPGTEVLASVYDVTTDKIRNNHWRQISRQHVTSYYLSYNWKTGQNGLGGSLSMEPMMVRGYGMQKSASMKPFADGLEEEIVVAFGTSVNEAIPFQLTGDASKAENDVKIREGFAKTLTFQPFLRPDRDGNISLNFTTSDKLSTFVISLFSHDKAMYNSVLRKEFVVTLPVKVSVAQPQYLYEGDRYVLKTDVSNISSEDVSGKWHVEVYDSENYRESTPIMTAEKSLKVKAGANASAEFTIDVPQCRTLGLKVSFISDGYQDGQFVAVPVHQASQSLTEAHSDLLMGNASKESLIADLRSRFVNTSADGAVYEEKKLMELFAEALPEPYYPDSKDAVSQSEALCINLIASKLCDSIQEDDYLEASAVAYSKLLGLFKNDGGVSWFEGGRSSQFITALILDRLAGLRERGLLVRTLDVAGENAASELEAKISGAVAFLDMQSFKYYSEESRLRDISIGQYLYVRVKYPDVKLDEDAITASLGKEAYGKVLSKFKDYLYKGSMQGDVLGKVMLIRILNQLAGNDTRATKLMEQEIASLKEYGVRHQSGAIYYPNAVMPFRGLIETEAYAHSMICNLYRDLGEDEMADGVRLWLMLQKENQEWNPQAGFAEAAASVYDASDAVMNSSVIVLKKVYQKPFMQIRKYGNDMSISAKYFKETVDKVTGKASRKELLEGESLNVGDRIYAEYKVWSAENRSFVRLSLPRHACLRPVEQLSGYRWSPWSYREVKDDRTLYWVEILPEEYITFTEELIVMQKGIFKSPSPEVESLYAPHYRASDGAQVDFVVEDLGQ